MFAADPSPVAPLRPPQFALTAPGVGMFLALAAGIALGMAGLPAHLAFALQGLALLGMAALWRRRRGLVLLALLLLAAVGAASLALYAPPRWGHACPAAGSLFRARVVAPVGRVVEAGEVAQKTVLQLDAEQVGPTWQARRGRVAVRLWPGQPLRRGDRIVLWLRLRPILAPANPGEPDMRQRARRLGLVAQAQVRSAHALQRPGHGLLAGLDAWRAAAAAALEAQLPDDLAPLAKAMALGDTASLTPRQRQQWGDAGMAHLLSVSGLHVGMVGAGIYALTRLGLALLPALAIRVSRRRLAALLGLPAMLVYCALSGASTPALRATMMAGCVAAAQLLRLPHAALQSWGISGVLLLLADPLALGEVGFLLSFVAVAALLVSVPDAGTSAASLTHRLLAALGASVRVSLATSAATLPICAVFFARVPLLAPLCNLVAVPLGALVATPLGLGVALAALPGTGAWGTWLQHLLAVPLQLALRALQVIATTVGGWPAACLTVPPPSAALLCALAVALPMALLARGRVRLGAQLAVLSWLMLQGGVVTALLPASLRQLPQQLLPGPPPAPLVRHIYVGQGDATLITLPHGEHILVDGGGAVLAGERDPGELTLLPLLRRWGVRRLALVVLTHPHPDHVGGLVAVTAALPVARLWTNGTGEHLAAVRTVKAQVRAAGGRVENTGMLPRETALDGTTLSLLHPRPGHGKGVYPQLHVNDNSVVLQLTYQGHSTLLCGDIEAAGEAKVAMQLRAPVTVLKAGHHGSNTSSTSRLLQAARPQAVIISCGEQNRYGFPHPQVLQRLAEAGTTVCRTDVHGMLSYRLQAPLQVVAQRLPPASIE